MRGIIVAGIGTGVGKTLVSAILARALSADYWKPISCGSDDTQVVARLLEGSGQVVLPESYTLPAPLSPHEAAARAGIEMDPSAVEIPDSGPLVIEMVGGVLVPFNETLLCIDLLQRFPCPVVVVVRPYLGSINHTLLTLEALTRRGIECLGLVVNGEFSTASEGFILSRSGLPVVGRIERELCVDRETVKQYGERWKGQMPWKALRA